GVSSRDTAGEEQLARRGPRERRQPAQQQTGCEQIVMRAEKHREELGVAQRGRSFAQDARHAAARMQRACQLVLEESVSEREPENETAGREVVAYGARRRGRRERE